MDEHTDGTKTNSGSLAKWFRIFLFLHVASLAVTVITDFPIEDGWASWVNKILSSGIVICLFRFSAVGSRYRKAAIFQTICFCGSLILLIVGSVLSYMSDSSVLGVVSSISGVVTLVLSILSLLAVYQEYSAHSELIAPADPKLSRKWHSLFNWEIAVGILAAFASVIVSIITVLLELDVARTVSIILAIVMLPEKILCVIYLLYLNRMIHLLEE